MRSYQHVEFEKFVSRFQLIHYSLNVETIENFKTQVKMWAN